MPTYTTPNGRLVYVNPQHVVMVQPAEDIGVAHIVLSPSAFQIGATGGTGGLTMVAVKENFTNVCRDMEKFERAVRRGNGALEVIK